MTKEEAQKLVDLINTMVEEGVEVVTEPDIIDKTETEDDKKIVGLSEEETEKLFRRSVPEGFQWRQAKAVRSPITGDRVFLAFNNEKRWIPDLETLEKMGFDLGSVDDIADDEIRQMKEGFALFSAKLW